MRTAYLDEDKESKLTSVFAMRYVPGFDDEILEALKNPDRDIHYEAVCAAGNWEIDAAWPHIAALINSNKTEKNLLLAAIQAVANIRPRGAGPLLLDLTDSDDEEIVQAADEAMALARSTLEADESEEEYKGEDTQGWIN